MLRGNLYGVTQLGGDKNCSYYGQAPGCGVVFKLMPPTDGQTQWTQQVLYAFKGGMRDGADPMAELTPGPGGVLYGATPDGGGIGCDGRGCGIVFKLTPPASGKTGWTETVLFRFWSLSNGHHPGRLTLGPNGTLYGAAQTGGDHGNGLIFQLTPPASGKGPWIETVLYRFQGGDDGRGPVDVIADGTGALFGTTGAGGGACNSSRGCGTAFKLTPPAAGRTDWTEAVLYRWKSGAGDGLIPGSGVVPDANGTLFGVTVQGGSHCRSFAPGCGTVFSLTGTGFTP